MKTQRNTNQTIRRALGRTIAAAAISAIAMSSMSVHASDEQDGYSADVPISNSKKEFSVRPIQNNFSFNFKLGGLGGFGRSDYYFEEQKKQFEKSATVDRAKINPFDNSSDNTFGSRLNYEEPIYSSNNSNFRDSYNTLDN